MFFFHVTHFVPFKLRDILRNGFYFDVKAAVIFSFLFIFLPLDLIIWLCLMLHLQFLQWNIYIFSIQSTSQIWQLRISHSVNYTLNQSCSPAFSHAGTHLLLHFLSHWPIVVTHKNNTHNPITNFDLVLSLTLTQALVQTVTNSLIYSLIYSVA